jgi:hypothetical protein
MKNLLVSAAVFALLALVLAVVVLAGFGALPAALVLPVVAFASAGLTLLASRTETVEIPEEYAIVDESELFESIEIVAIVEIPAARLSSFVSAGALLGAFVAPSVVFAALVLAGFGVIAL